MDSVVPLEQRIEELVQPDWFTTGDSTPVVVPSQELLDGEFGREIEDLREMHLAEPVAVFRDCCPDWIENR